MTLRKEPVLGLSATRRAAGAAHAPCPWRLAGVAVWACLVAAVFGLAAPAAAMDVSALPSPRSIDLPVGQSRLIRFDKPVESVFVADPSIADLRVVSQDVIYVYGTKLGTTNLIAISADKRIQASIQFRVLMNSAPPNAAIRESHPTTMIDISFLGGRAVLEGEAKSVEEAERAVSIGETYSPQGQPPVNNMTIGASQQVNIRVRFAEISRNDLKTFGINWEILAGNFSFGMVNNTEIKKGGRNLGIGFDGGSFKAEALIDSLKANGIMKILAEPNLTAVSGQDASFLAGGEIPIPVPQDRDRITIAYKKFGVSLDFTPTVLGRNRIGLRVKPEVSSLSAAGAIQLGGYSVPSFTVRRADTTVEVGSGQTFAIAGLFQRNVSTDVQKFPGLGDLPILGDLFTSTRYRRDETELVILITPYIVEPTSSRRMATPLDRPERAPEPVYDVEAEAEPEPRPRRAVRASQPEPAAEAEVEQAAEEPPPATPVKTQQSGRSQRSGLRF